MVTNYILRKKKDIQKRKPSCYQKKKKMKGLIRGTTPNLGAPKTTPHTTSALHPNVWKTLRTYVKVSWGTLSETV